MADPRLIEIIRQASRPPVMGPPPDLPADMAALLFPGSGLPPREGFPPLEGIRVILFDVYGTLFVSAAGDIGAGDITDGTECAGGSQEALDALAREYGGAPEDLRAYFHGEVLRRHEERRSRTPYPEVRVEEIWEHFLRQRGAAGPGVEARAEELALRYELAINPVYPMPGARETLEVLKNRGFRLGLISNAQFFTPLLFDAFFGASPEELGFDPELLIFSYILGEAKPSPALFAPAVRSLASRGLPPERGLYIGNDMLKDIFAASGAGFKTVLFAGDRRSLRLREGNALTQNTRPDRIIRDLRDLPAWCQAPFSTD